MRRLESQGIVGTMHISIKPEVLFNLGPIPVTNSLVTSTIGALLLILLAVIVGNNYKRLPSGLQSIFEMVYEMFENLTVDSLGKTGVKFVPIIITFFLFIITNNWIGVLPGIGSIVLRHDTPAAEHKEDKAVKAEGDHKEGEAVKAEGDHAGEAKYSETPLFRGGNADLNTTFALALVAMAFVHINGVRSAGLGHHLAHFKNPLEIVSELGKILSFSFRLFGNIFAGEVLLGAMASIFGIVTKNFGVAWYGIPGGLIATPFLFFELFVGFIQAFVFAVLAISFLSLFYKTETSGHH